MIGVDFFGTLLVLFVSFPNALQLLVISTESGFPLFIASHCFLVIEFIKDCCYAHTTFPP